MYRPNLFKIVNPALLLLTLTLHCGWSQAQSAEDVRNRLVNNQSNINHLRKEKQLLKAELELLLEQRPAADISPLKARLSPADPQLQAAISELQDSIAIADTLIYNLSATTSRQRLLLATLERGKAPSALDIALNKALGSNLPELTRSLANNEAAQREITLLRALLKEEAGIGHNKRAEHTDIEITEEPQVAEGEFLNLLALFSSGAADESEDKVIKISGQLSKQHYSELETLSYLGHSQYHMEATVHAGNMTFTIDSKPWQLRIPKKDDNATYMVIYDLRKLDKPRLIMFNKSLLLE